MSVYTYSTCPSLLSINLPTQVLVLLFALLLAISVFTITVNAGLLYSLHKTNQLSSVTSKLIFTMSISDMTSGIMAYPAVAVLFFDGSANPTSCATQLFIQFLVLLLAYFSFFMLYGVAVDRYFHVTKLNRYNEFMNSFKMKLFIAFSVVLSLITAVISTIFSSFYLKIFLNVFNLLVILQILMLYKMVSNKIQSHVAQTLARTDNPLNQAEDRKDRQQTRQQLNTARTIKILTILLLLLSTPYNILSLAWVYYKFHKRVEPSTTLNILEALAYLIIFMNTGVNALVYGYGNSLVKRYVINKFKKGGDEVAPST